MSSERPGRRVTWAVAALVVAALALRVYAIGFGLPDILHPDESPILNRALAFAEGSANPRNFLYPTLYLYALFVWEGLFFVVSRIAGVYQSVADFQRAFFLDPTRVVIAARVLAAIFSSLTVLATYRAAARLYDRATGAWAAAFLAFAPLAVRDAHYVKLDVPMTLFVVLCLGAVAKIVMDPGAADRARSWVITGALAGLAISTQYYAVFAVVPIALAAVDDGWRHRSAARAAKWLAASGAATFAGFVAGSPFFLAELPAVARDFAELRKVDVDRAVSAGAFSSLGRYLDYLWRDAVGWPIVLLAIVGLGVAVVADRRRAIVLAGFALPFLAFLANTFPASRYLNPLVPVVCIAAASVVGLLARRSARAPLVACVLVVPSALMSLRVDRFLSMDDTRSQMRAFIERTVPDGASILIQPHGAPLRQSREGLVEALRAHLGSESRASIKFQSQLALDPYPSPAYRTIYLGEGGLDADKIYVSPSVFDSGTLAPLRALRVAYVVLTRYNDGNAAFAPLEAALNREGHVLATFAPYRADVPAARKAATAPFFHNTADRIDAALERPGPTIAVWQLH